MTCLTKVKVNTSFTPSVDVVVKKTSYQILADLPGLKQKDIKVEVKNGCLTISGEKKYGKIEEDKHYYRKEISSGYFSRSFNIDGLVDVDKIVAKYQNGQLLLNLPKIEAVLKKEEAKQIQIK